MHRKFYIGLNVLVVSTIGGWLGEVLFGGGAFGIPSLIGGTIFIAVGYYTGHKMADYLGG
ncbi:MAG TPA: hypothetical protein VMR34_01385 [Candidatus Saccharimonadales bacterium]|nr:hypothetical protein [Candidatus Saccharimonadales bacterium]